jgi:plasmid maintenance system antidote protein VapI
VRKPKKYKVNQQWYTLQEVAAKLNIKESTASKRLSDTDQPWTWGNLRRERYKPAPAKYRIDNKIYSIQEVAKELKLTIDAARGRIYQRLESYGVLTWHNLRANKRGSGMVLAKLVGDKPASSIIRHHLNKQIKSIAQLGRLIGVTNPEYMRRITAGERTLTPEMAERIAEALMLDDDETNDFYLAGARQAGWKIRKGNSNAGQD